MKEGYILIHANDISVSGCEIDQSLPIEWSAAHLSEEDFRCEETVHVRAKLSKSSKNVIVRGSVETHMIVPCSRCLNDAHIHVQGEMTLFLRPASHGSHSPKKGSKDSDEYEFDQSEANDDTYDGEMVVLDDFVREAVLLELPTFPLCSEDCKGVAPEVKSISKDSSHLTNGESSKAELSKKNPFAVLADWMNKPPLKK